MTRLVPVLLVAFGLLGSALRVEAQIAAEPAWSPTRNSLTLGVHAYGTDGTTARRVGVGWYFSPQFRTNVMARFWGAHDQVEVESRWIRASDRAVRPFAAASLLWQERSTRTSVGGTVGGGVELYFMDPFMVDIGLGWQSLFGVSGVNDHHWFRVDLGIAVVPIPWFAAGPL